MQSNRFDLRVWFSGSGNLRQLYVFEGGEGFQDREGTPVHVGGLEKGTRRGLPVSIYDSLRHYGYRLSPFTPSFTHCLNVPLSLTATIFCAARRLNRNSAAGPLALLVVV